ncbi:cell wall-active antibiotics response protein, partial [Myxococcota bacterium]|nr:cell wall-active antibiotics response protein [Myxococcota bacterium]MBU1538053.1 cell wall-active antibiotics response protein [Myxococcota bacterium]
HRHSDRHFLSSAFFGLTIMGVGVLFLLDHLDLLQGYRAFQFWPIFIGLWGVFRLIMPGRLPEKIWGLSLVTGGSLALLHTLEIVTVPWSIIWPLLVVAAGLHVILTVIWTKRRRDAMNRQFTEIEGNMVSHVIMGEKEERIDHAPFKGGAVDVVMGSYVLDLRKAEFSPGKHDLWVKAFMGEVIVKVPATLNVFVDGSQIMGTIENDAPRTRDDQEHPTLTIHAQVALGSIKIQ